MSEGAALDVHIRPMGGHGHPKRPVILVVSINCRLSIQPHWSYGPVNVFHDQPETNELFSMMTHVIGYLIRPTWPISNYMCHCKYVLIFASTCSNVQGINRTLGPFLKQLCFALSNRMSFHLWGRIVLKIHHAESLIIHDTFSSTDYHRAHAALMIHFITEWHRN